MRVLAVDQGEKRIGLAISDETGTIAQSIGYVTSIAELLQVATEREAGRILVGWPRRLDGSSSPQTERVEAFIETLKAATALPVLKWDERLTTAQATRVLLEGDVRRKVRREKIDQLAAQLLLQNYLDANSEGGACAPPEL